MNAPPKISMRDSERIASGHDAIASLWEQFSERADDAVRLHGRARRQAVAMDVHPDGVDAKLLRHLDFPFEIVADHPGVGGGDAERVHGVQVGTLLRFAKAVLALDLDMVKAMRQLETLD